MQKSLIDVNLRLGVLQTKITPVTNTDIIFKSKSCTDWGIYQVYFTKMAIGQAMRLQTNNTFLYIFSLKMFHGKTISHNFSYLGY